MERVKHECRMCLFPRLHSLLLQVSNYLTTKHHSWPSAESRQIKRSHVFQVQSPALVCPRSSSDDEQKEHSKALADLVCKDDFFSEVVSQLPSAKDAIMTVGRAQYVIDFLLDIQPTCEKIDELMAEHGDGVKLLCQISQAVLSDVDHWQSGLKAAQKARDEKTKAEKKELDRQARLKKAEEKKLEKKRQKEQARQAAADAKEREEPEEDGRKRRARKNLQELEEDKDSKHTHTHT